MSINYQGWMPSQLAQGEKDTFTATCPDDPHMAAALAWEYWAASGAGAEDGDGAAPSIASVQTGAQTVTYEAGTSNAVDRATSRAAWHRARAKTRSVEVGPQFDISLPEGAHLVERRGNWWYAGETRP